MPPPERRRKRIVRRAKGSGILRATVLVLAGLILVAGGLWIGFTRLFRDAWPWQEGGLETTTPTPGFQTTQLVLTLVAGIGGAILVVVAYRRQRDLELARFDERFAAAAAQLGAPTAAERLAGVYAMAALADTWKQHRQQCIDVLCGYLRLPYDPTNTLLKTVANERIWYVDDRPEQKQTWTYEQLPNDREVRLTIISTITRHLRDPADGGAPVSWQGHDLDFTGATFDGGDFGMVTFSGGMVTFTDAKFTGGTVTFQDANSPAAPSPSRTRSSPAAPSTSPERSSPEEPSASTGRSSATARSTSHRRSSPAAWSPSVGRCSPSARSVSIGSGSPGVW